MEHAKKMLLVDPVRLSSAAAAANPIPAADAATALSHAELLKTLYRPSMIDKQLSKLDTNIASTLHSDLPDDIKAKHYESILRNYRYLEPTTPFESPAAARHKAEEEEDDNYSLQSVPKYLRKQGKQLLRNIKPHVRWNDGGEIGTEDDGVIQNSDIGALIEATIDGSNRRPTGYTAFRNVLKRANTPRRLIKNSKLWYDMNTPKKKTTKRRSKSKTPDWSKY